jgi:hypothetical protein
LGSRSLRHDSSHTRQVPRRRRTSLAVAAIQETRIQEQHHVEHHSSAGHPTAEGQHDADHAASAVSANRVAAWSLSAERARHGRADLPDPAGRRTGLKPSSGRQLRAGALAPRRLLQGAGVPLPHGLIRFETMRCEHEVAAEGRVVFTARDASLLRRCCGASGFDTQRVALLRQPGCHSRGCCLVLWGVRGPQSRSQR